LSLAQELKQRAREVGADLVGIAPAAPGPQAARLASWLRAGLGDGLAFLQRDAGVRQDIRLWYPEARSVLVCGFAYDGGPRPTVPVDAGHPPLIEGDGAPAPGRLARYAVCADYHHVLKERLESVLSWLRQRRSGAHGRVFVDSSPVLERLYGAAAGLGWVGRNCLLVSEERGSFFLLAGIALDLELEADLPVPERCGACRRCLEACPSGALRERELDAKSCTAYLTIEHRGPVPEQRRSGTGYWVAGCDLCQEACPFNERLRPGSVLKPLLPRDIPLEELATMDEAAFRRRFGLTPLARLKRQGLVRNALLAMGNSGQARWRPVLDGLLADPDPVLREQALWSLARLPS